MKLILYTIIATIIVTATSTTAFTANFHSTKRTMRRMVSSSSSESESDSDSDRSSDAVEQTSGSFFHKVPPPDNTNDTNADNNSNDHDDDNSIGEFDLSLRKAMEMRSTSRAKTESTINGVPTKGEHICIYVYTKVFHFCFMLIFFVCGEI